LTWIDLRVKSNPRGRQVYDSSTLRLESMIITVSDNPGVKSGVAIELGWDYNVSERTHIDNFEERRSKERSTNFMKEKKVRNIMSRLELLMS